MILTTTKAEPRSPLPVMLVRAAWFSVGVIALSAVGLLVDARAITGAPAWLKPAKFGLSTLAYVFTLALMVRDLPRTRTLRVAIYLTSVLLIGEVSAICVQAARGTTSHFNFDSPFDSALFASMGFGIAVVWLSSAMILWQHWRTPASDRAMAMAFRFGLALNVLGAGTGWTMTRPFPGQIAAIERGERPRIIGSHTVGASDGGTGLPITRWSDAHGDLRVPHFFGMHALQLLPLLLLLARRVRGRRDDAVERSGLAVGATMYAAAWAALLVQALNGHPLISLAGS